MNFSSHFVRRFLLFGLGLFLAAAHIAQSAEIRVITSGAFTEAYKKMVPEFEKQTGHKVISAFGASMGNAPDAISIRF